MNLILCLLIYTDDAISADSDDESLSSSSDGSSSSASSSSSSSEDEDEEEGERADSDGLDSMDESTMDSTTQKEYDKYETLRSVAEIFEVLGGFDHDLHRWFLLLSSGKTPQLLFPGQRSKVSGKPSATRFIHHEDDPSSDKTSIYTHRLFASLLFGFN